jgi:hypothetical protein
MAECGGYRGFGRNFYEFLAYFWRPLNGINGKKDHRHRERNGFSGGSGAGRKLVRLQQMLEQLELKDARLK